MYLLLERHVVVAGAIVQDPPRIVEGHGLWVKGPWAIGRGENEVAGANGFGDRHLGMGWNGDLHGGFSSMAGPDRPDVDDIVAADDVDCAVEIDRRIAMRGQELDRRSRAPAPSLQESRARHARRPCSERSSPPARRASAVGVPLSVAKALKPGIDDDAPGPDRRNDARRDEQRRLEGIVGLAGRDRAVARIEEQRYEPG